MEGCDADHVELEGNPNVFDCVSFTQKGVIGHEKSLVTGCPLERKIRENKPKQKEKPHQQRRSALELALSLGLALMRQTQERHWARGMNQGESSLLVHFDLSMAWSIGV